MGPDGSIKESQYGNVIAFMAPDGQTLKSGPYGNIIAHLDPDGTIKSGPYGSVLGVVGSDGTIRANAYGGSVLGHVSPPHQQIKAALFLIR